MQTMLKKWGTKILFVIGFALCAFPAVYGLIGQQQQSNAISTYQSAVDSEDEDTIAEAYEEAQKYNDILYQTGGAIADDGASILTEDSYQSLLNLSGTGVMGSLEIPTINVNLPIYHGTDDDVLSAGIGHLEGSSLPTGGENTHCVLSGHRGLPSSKLLVRLDEVEEGDYFYLRICDNTLAYKVTQIQVVEPDEVESLSIQAGKDLCSIVTCTPYGINTHRLIVTGERVEYSESLKNSISEGTPSIREVVITVLPFAFLSVVVIFYIRDRRKRR